MSEKVHPNDEGRYSKSEAEDEAILIQNMLFEWKAGHLRDHKGFPPEKYESASESANVINEIKKQIGQMPAQGVQRIAILEDLLRKYPIPAIMVGWREFLEGEYPKSKELEKFRSYSNTIFREADREYYETEREYETGVFNYGAASHFYMVMAHRLYEEISGAPYLSPQELKYNFEGALKGKEILELAPGPGWFMKVLKGMGANVVGLEKAQPESFRGTGMSEFIGKGDATDLEFIFGQNKFDLILSNNFLNVSTVTNAEAIKITQETLATLKEGGRAIHATQLFVRPNELNILSKIVNDPRNVNHYLDHLSHPSIHGELGAEDLPIIDPDIAKSLGAKDVRDGYEAGYHYLSYSK